MISHLALRQSHIGLFPLLAKAYRLLLTAAPTVCKDERSFSKTLSGLATTKAHAFNHQLGDREIMSTLSGAGTTVSWG